ncbi:outer membrane beta-barrel protein [Parasediminibacterium sp. JCM 36343]|uniref:outer membrane beta-barrel protein n=1 Tax=Parasediminibacterium sp. JCM 36343 TaxID=3374279 RepID=UPI003978380D
MTKLYLLLTILLLANTIHAQTIITGSITGKLIDSVGKQSLKDASITVLDATDSTLEVFGLSKEGGVFEINNISLGSYMVQINFQGYQPLTKKITLSKQKPTLDMGKIYLAVQSNMLTEVIVFQNNPITIKNDTVEYNAGSFKTKPNAVVEDLLKKLPGVLVDKDGNINAQGEQVQRIFVDGKRFFGNDPKMATKNLPPDIIDKIQVYDAMSDQSAFSGFDDGTRIKTINITTKKNRKKGYFGRAIAAAGDQGRYEENANFSRFKNDQKITVLAQANDINVQGFTAQDGGGSGRSRAGITTTEALGLNFTDLWAKKADFSGSYFFNNLSTNRDSRSFTEKFIPNNDTSNFTNSATSNNRTTLNHRINLNLEQKFDTMNTLIVRPDISFQNSNGTNQTIANTSKSVVYNENAINQNDLNQRTSSNGTSVSGSINGTFRHRFKKPGNTFSISLTESLNNSNNSGTNYALTHYYVPLDSVKLANQTNGNIGNSHSFNGNFSYTFPIMLNHVVELSYGYNSNTNTSDRKTYSYDSVAKSYNFLVDSLTNYFENYSSSNRVSIAYRIKTEKANFSIGNGVQYTNLKSDNPSKDSHFNRNFTNIYPTASYTYNFSRKQVLRINYSGRSNQPSIAQLQPVPNNGNQANIVTGNPNLGQEFSHNFRFLYTSVNQITFRNISGFLNAGITTNKVVNSTTQLANGYQTTTCQNQNGTFYIRGNFNYGFQVNKPKSNLNFITNGGLSRDVSLINNAINYTNNSSVGEAINWTMNLDEKLDLNLNTGYTYNLARYSIKSENNKNYYVESFSVEPTYTFNGGWVLGSTFDYTFNSGLAQGYNASLPLWNASLAKQLFSNKQGEIKFSVFDLLNQNVSVSRNTTNNYIQDVQNNVLQRFFMVTFTYNLRKFAGQQKQLDAAFKNIMGDGNGNNPGKQGGGKFRN